MSAPIPLARAIDALPDWGVAPDGAHFLFLAPVGPRPPFDVTLNWDRTAAGSP
jgi:hypothetical protein